jgi:hypothetical protein
MTLEEFHTEIRAMLCKVPLPERKAWDGEDLSSWSLKVRTENPYLTWRTRGSVWQSVAPTCSDLIGPKAH